MRRCALVVLTVAGLLAVTVPSRAIEPAAQLIDATGDANGINGQRFGIPVPSTSTSPASDGASDIVSVRFATVFKKGGNRSVPIAFTVTMTLAAAPRTGVLYGVRARVPKTCDGAGTDLYLDYEDLGSTPVDSVSCSDPAAVGGASNDVAGGAAFVDAANHTITWTVDAGLKPGAVVDSLAADTSAFVLGLIDEATTTRTYVYGK